MSTTTLEHEALALSDHDLIRETHDACREVDDDDLRDRLHWLVGEVVERFCPGLEYDEHVRYYREEYESKSSRNTRDVLAAADEIDATRAAMVRRYEARLRAREAAA